MEVVFKRVETPERSKTVARIAAPIWHATYDAINGADATDYMIEQFQSVPAIRRQLDREGHAYYPMLRGGEPWALSASVPHKEGKMFLSKLYVSQAHCGRACTRGV